MTWLGLSIAVGETSGLFALIGPGTRRAVGSGDRGPGGPAHPAVRSVAQRSAASLALVLVVAPVPHAGAQVARTHEQALVAPAWRAVEPLVHAPETVQPARVRRVGVVDDAILEREGAHPRQLARVRRGVRSER